MDMIDNLNRQLTGWAAFYKFTDLTATTDGRSAAPTGDEPGGAVPVAKPGAKSLYH